MQAAQSLQLPVSPTNTGRPKLAIALTLAIAILLHIVFILMPRISQLDLPEQRPARIEIQVDRYEPVPSAVEQAEIPPEVVQPLVEKPPTPIDTPVETLQPEPQDSSSLVATELQPKPVEPIKQSPEISQQELQALTDSILSSQFIREPSSTEKIFGPPLVIDPQPEQKTFHFPERQNMISMLDKPVPDLPFEYTQGLVVFAYEPGVKGDIQRFWDTITPEFGWRTKYGTKVKCVWVLVIAACGWGRSDD